MNPNLPPLNTPLYNHPLPQIEAWLTDQGCERSDRVSHAWRLNRSDWQAEIELDSDQVVVRYLGASAEGQDISRSFKYSLSRQDIQNAIWAGP
jgi:hypothetical protein